MKSSRGMEWRENGCAVGTGLRRPRLIGGAAQYSFRSPSTIRIGDRLAQRVLQMMPAVA
jgi:hypothetical protein